MSPLEIFYEKPEEPSKSCLAALRRMILKSDPQITEAWKYRMPFFCYRDRMCCYLWIKKKSNKPYLGIVEGNSMKHPDLIAEKRSRIKIFVIDPGKNLPVAKIKSILKEMLTLYKQ